MTRFEFIFAFIFAGIFFLPVSYLLSLFEFKRDIRKYNSMMPEQYQIPYPTTFKELQTEFTKYRKRMWLLHYEMYQYHEYITEVDDYDNT